MVDSLNSQRTDGEEEMQVEGGFEIKQVDRQIEIVPSKSPVYDNLSPAGEPVHESAVDHQLKVLYQGEGVSPPHAEDQGLDDGRIDDGEEEQDKLPRYRIGEGQEESDEEEEQGVFQERFIRNDMVFTQGGTTIVENRETLDLSRPDHMHGHYEGDAEEGTEEREAEEQF